MPRSFGGLPRTKCSSRPAHFRGQVAFFFSVSAETIRIMDDCPGVLERGVVSLGELQVSSCAGPASPSRSKVRNNLTHCYRAEKHSLPSKRMYQVTGKFVNHGPQLPGNRPRVH